MTSCAPTFPPGRAEQWVRVIPGPASTASPGGRPSFSANAQADRSPHSPEWLLKATKSKQTRPTDCGCLLPGESRDQITGPSSLISLPLTHTIFVRSLPSRAAPRVYHVTERRYVLTKRRQAPTQFTGLAALRPVTQLRVRRLTP